MDEAGTVIEAGSDAQVVIASLSLATSTPAAMLDLNVEGTAGWVHWGRNDEQTVNERADATGAIPTFTIANATAKVDLRTLGDNMTSFKWSGGTPKADEPGTTTGVYSKTGHPVFTLRRAVKTTTKMRMVVYAGTYKALGRFTVRLGDKPGDPMSSADLESEGKPGDKNFGRIAIDYQSSDPAKELIITWEMIEAHDTNNGNVTLCAATLSAL